MKLQRLVILSIGLLLSTFGKAQKRNYDSLFFNIQKGLTNLYVSANRTGNSQFRENISAVSVLMSNCFNAISNNPRRYTLDTLYFEEFCNYSELLNNEARIRDTAYVIRLLHFLKEDITAKYQVGFNATTAIPQLVNVRVKVYRTVDNQNVELNGYDVFVRPEIAFDDLQTIQFNPTAFSVKDIPRGYKTFWIQKGRIKVDSVTTYVGLHSTLSDSVIFVIP